LTPRRDTGFNSAPETIFLPGISRAMRRGTRQQEHSPAQHLAAARKELLATRRGEEESENAEATTRAHFVIWFNKKDDGPISGIQKPSADGAASTSGLRNAGSDASRGLMPVVSFSPPVALPKASSTVPVTSRDG
jgi:hypothetical protein